MSTILTSVKLLRDSAQTIQQEGSFPRNRVRSVLTNRACKPSIGTKTYRHLPSDQPLLIHSSPLRQVALVSALVGALESTRLCTNIHHWLLYLSTQDLEQTANKEWGRLDFRFCGFGQLLVRFFGFPPKSCGFSVLVSCAVCEFPPFQSLAFGFFRISFPETRVTSKLLIH